MMLMNHLTLFIRAGVLIILLFGCQLNGSNRQSCTLLNDAQKIKKHKQILQEKFSGTPLQSGAVDFLLDNFRYHSCKNGEREKLYTSFVEENRMPVSERNRRLKELKQVTFVPSSFQPDAAVTDHCYLEDQLQITLEVLKKASWSETIPAKVLNHYIVPYRISGEVLSGKNWKRSYLDTLLNSKEKPDNLFSKQTVAAALPVVFDWFKKRKSNFEVKWGRNHMAIPDLSLETVDLLSTGSCQELAKVNVAALRSLAIPAALDFTPNFLNVNSGHEWAAVVINDRKCIPFDIQNKFLGKFKREVFKVSKVYRRTFSPDRASHYFKRGPVDFLPPLFNDPFITDVTSAYSRTAHCRIKVGKEQIASGFGYLATYRNPGWTPVDFGAISKGRIAFRQVALGGPYLVIAKEYGETIVLSKPFFLDRNGSVKWIENGKQSSSVRLTRKSPDFEQDNRNRTGRMTGGYFEGSMSPDFNPKTRLFTITSNPGDTYNTVTLKKPVKCRYVRYVSPPSSHGNVSELAFYDLADKVLGGRFIGSTELDPETKERKISAVFDANPLTYFNGNSPDGYSMGLDLGSIKKMNKIRFLARSDMNGINIDDTYELFYWNNKWVSLGKKKAFSTTVTYSKVPENALLLLKNLRGGYEERPFIMVNNKQEWL